MAWIMDRLAAFRTFLRVLDTGSFSEAAREANTGQPTVSKQVAALEHHLGVQLIARSTRALVPTEEGRRFAEAARAAVEAAEAAEAAARGEAGVTGLLRLGCPVAFAQAQIVPRLPAFLARHGQVSVDLVMSDAFLDPVEQGVDVVVRIGALADSALVARRIGTTQRVTVASPGYLARRPPPEAPIDLAGHDCVLYARLATGDAWPYRAHDGTEASVRVSGRLRADSSAAIRGAVLAGAGIALAPLWLVGEDLAAGRLVRLLADWEPTALPIHAVSAPRRFTPPKATAIVAYLAEAFREDPFVSARGD
ncbi:MAG: LysR family transcriptional regulator [Paracoccaceae bacterium]